MRRSVTDPTLSSVETVASDAVDRILLREVRDLISEADEAQPVVLDDATGGLTVSIAGLAGSTHLRARCDSLLSERTVASAARTARISVKFSTELDRSLLAAATLVVLRLPKSLAALDEIAAVVAHFADPRVVLLAGGRVKHMTHGMNRVLLGHFRSVRASLGQQKSRVLIANDPIARDLARYPISRRHDDLDLTVCAHGAAFAGTSVDLGTRFLSSFLDRMDSTARSVVDLGCGTGVLASLVARQLPLAAVLAVDESCAACRSTTATARVNGVADRVNVRRTDLLAGVPDATVDLVVCNPPFHRGTTRDSDPAFRMFSDAARALRPGGELWTVYNSHLPYLAALRRLVGPAVVVGQNPRFCVTRSRR